MVASATIEPEGSISEPGSVFFKLLTQKYETANYRAQTVQVCVSGIREAHVLDASSLDLNNDWAIYESTTVTV